MKDFYLFSTREPLSVLRFSLFSMFTAKGGSLRKALYKRHKSETNSGTASLQRQPQISPINEPTSPETPTRENPIITEPSVGTIVEHVEMAPVIADTDSTQKKPPTNHHRSNRMLVGTNHRNRIKSANAPLPMSNLGDNLTIDVNCVCNATDLRSAPHSGPIPGQCKVPGHEKHGHFRSSSASPHIRFVYFRV